MRCLGNILDRNIYIFTDNCLTFVAFLNTYGIPDPNLYHVSLLTMFIFYLYNYKQLQNSSHIYIVWAICSCGLHTTEWRKHPNLYKSSLYKPNFLLGMLPYQIRALKWFPTENMKEIHKLQKWGCGLSKCGRNQAKANVLHAILEKNQQYKLLQKIDSKFLWLRAEIGISVWHI